MIQILLLVTGMFWARDSTLCGLCAFECSSHKLCTCCVKEAEVIIHAWCSHAQTQQENLGGFASSAMSVAACSNSHLACRKLAVVLADKQC